MAGLASVCAPACAGSDAAQVEGTLERFYAAAGEGNGRQACERLTPAARAPAGGLECETAIDQLGRLGGEQTQRRFAAVEVRNVRVDGDRATAQVQIPTQTPTTLQLEKVPSGEFRWNRSKGEWKIASLGAVAGGDF